QPALSHAISSVRGGLVLGYGNDNATEAAIRQRCQEFAAWTAEASAAGLERYFAATSRGTFGADEQELASSCARTLSNICNQLYFGSGAFHAGQRDDEQGLQTIDARRMFLDDVGPIL